MGIYYSHFAFYGFKIENNDEMMKIQEMLIEQGVQNSLDYFDTKQCLFIIPETYVSMNVQAGEEELEQGFVPTAEVERVIGKSLSELFESVDRNYNRDILEYLKNNYSFKDIRPNIGPYFAESLWTSYNPDDPGTSLQYLLPIGEAPCNEIKALSNDLNDGYPEPIADGALNIDAPYVGWGRRSVSDYAIDIVLDAPMQEQEQGVQPAEQKASSRRHSGSLSPH